MVLITDGSVRHDITDVLGYSDGSSFSLSGAFGSLFISQLYLTILFYSRQENGKGTVSEVGRPALPPHCLTLNIQLNWPLSAFYL